MVRARRAPRLSFGLSLRRRQRAPEGASAGDSFGGRDLASCGTPGTAGGHAGFAGRTGLEDATLQAVHDLLREGRDLDAIRRVREESGVGLAEAKALVDALESRGGGTR